MKTGSTWIAGFNIRARLSAAAWRMNSSGGPEEKCAPFSSAPPMEIFKGKKNSGWWLMLIIMIFYFKNLIFLWIYFLNVLECTGAKDFTQACFDEVIFQFHSSRKIKANHSITQTYGGLIVESSFQILRLVEEMKIFIQNIDSISKGNKCPLRKFMWETF